jgi:hypothetical protein
VIAETKLTTETWLFAFFCGEEQLFLLAEPERKHPANPSVTDSLHKMQWVRNNDGDALRFQETLANYIKKHRSNRGDTRDARH